MPAQEGGKILRRLTGEIKKRIFATIDIEATDWVNPYACGFFDGKNYTDWVGKTAVQDGLRHVLTPKYAGYWIYAHNGGNYDFLFFLRHLLTDKGLHKRFRCEITPIGSCVMRADVFLTGKMGEVLRDDEKPLKWTFVDSARLMPIALKDLGETFGTGKKVNIGMTYNELAQPENEATMRHYLKVDCTLLHSSIAKMQDTINGLGGQMGVTLPSTALDVFRRKFQKGDIHINRHFPSCPERDSKPTLSTCKGCAHDFARESYFGGRTEIFRMQFNPYIDDQGQKVDTAQLWDINSHYPHCMLEPMPVGPGIFVNGLTEADVFDNARTMTGLVECDVEIPSDCYLPPLPVKHQGKLIFPVGTLSGIWDAEELKLLPKVGGRILITRRSLWFQNETIFAPFIRRMYKYRDKKGADWSKGMDWIAKILMNSLYGKFGMREERNRIVIHPDSPEGLQVIDMASDVWSEDLRVSPQYIVPQLSVHVTAIARARLWQILHDVLKAGGRIYYCDTDSVVCSGAHSLVNGDKLGELKLEENITRAMFVLPKLYLLETEGENRKKQRESHIKVKAKGMGPGIRLGNEGDDELGGQLSEKEFLDLVTKGVPLMRHRLTKFAEGLRSYAKEALVFPRVIAAPKQIQSQYDKRKVLENYDTAPHCFPFQFTRVGG